MIESQQYTQPALEVCWQQEFLNCMWKLQLSTLVSVPIHHKQVVHLPCVLSMVLVLFIIFYVSFLVTGSCSLETSPDDLTNTNLAQPINQVRKNEATIRKQVQHFVTYYPLSVFLYLPPFKLISQLNIHASLRQSSFCLCTGRQRLRWGKQVSLSLSLSSLSLSPLFQYNSRY